MLLASNTDDRHVWFGRIYPGRSEHRSEPGAREYWKHVAAVAADMQDRKRDLLLLTTDFESLHALKVSEIRFGEDAVDKALPSVPDYYRHNDVALWFKVNDIRVLRHVKVQTLSWLQDHTQIDMRDQAGRPLPFDPYMSLREEAGRYPICIRTDQGLDEVFDYDALNFSVPEPRLYAALPGTTFPPDREHALEDLRNRLGEHWDTLEGESVANLVSAMEVERIFLAYGEGAAVDASSAFIHLAKAIELESGKVIALLREYYGNPQYLLTFKDGDPLTFGGFTGALSNLRADKRQDVPPRTRDLVWSITDTRWLKDFTDARNDAAHIRKDPLKGETYRKHKDALLEKWLPFLCASKKELLALLHER